MVALGYFCFDMTHKRPPANKLALRSNSDAFSDLSQKRAKWRKRVVSVKMLAVSLGGQS